jgi:hypothetical protein
MQLLYGDNVHRQLARLNRSQKSQSGASFQKKATNRMWKTNKVPLVAGMMMIWCKSSFLLAAVPDTVLAKMLFFVYQPGLTGV